MTTTLSVELLVDFERALRSVGAAITETWAAGLTDDEIDRLLLPVDIDLPEEARVWWRWRNGVGPDTSAPRWDLIPNRPLYDLKTAVDVYEPDREAMLELDGADRRLIPVGDQPWIFFDCGGPRSEPVPIYVGGHGQATQFALPSIGELVLIWIDLIDRGIFTTDDHGIWQLDFDKIPPDVARLGVY